LKTSVSKVEESAAEKEKVIQIENEEIAKKQAQKQTA